MAGLSTDMTMHVHITWDTEPTEEAKNFVRVEVLQVLQGTFQDSSWLTELVRTEVQKVMQDEVTRLHTQIGRR